MSTAVLCMAAVALVGWSTSLVLAGVLPWLARVRARITGAAHARLVLVLIAAPAILSVVAVAVSLLPSIGVGHDHCQIHGSHHPHLCFAHATGPVGVLAGLLSSALLLRLLVAGARVASAVREGWRTGRALEQAGSRARGATVIHERGSHAFVVGMLRPRVFLTQELVERTGPDELEAVLAHEAGHARRRDPLRRVIARLALAFHLPGVGFRLEEELALAHELAADEHAASSVGDPDLVAETIVRIARRRHADRAAVAAWGGGADLSTRVHRLLAGAPRRDLPSARIVTATLVAVVVIVGVAGDQVHHALETLLGLIS